jgi:peptidoglycan/xylan/chitin deacetylase (PgdA/CDA1 family)
LEHHQRDGFDWGDFRRTDPVSRDWGYDRGGPIDRRYIDAFLSAHSSDVRGAVLEIQEDDFTLAYGGGRVTAHDVVDLDASNPRATVFADLRAAAEIASEAYDCIILTQTLHVIDDMSAALRECYRVLKPGGVLLATFPAASRVCLEYGVDGDYWRMTPAGARALVREAFAPAITSSTSFGNVLTNTAFLHGLGASELTDKEFTTHDPYFPALTGIRAKKAGAVCRNSTRGAVLLYHRVDDTPDVHGLGVPAQVFEAHLQWLGRECHVLSIEDLLSTANEDLPERAVAVTFDDGYLDNLTLAGPLLQQHQVPAAFFLTTRGLREPVEYWWDTLERLVLQASTPPILDMNRAGIPLTFETTTPEQRHAAHWRLHERLVHASIRERDRAIEWLRNWSGPGTPRVRPMTGDEVLALLKHPGITIGAHTVNHAALPDVPDARLLEMNDCRVELRWLTGQPVELFAYPYGAVDRETAAVVRGFWRWGMSCDEGILGDSFDAARVPRLDVKAWREDEFAARVSRLFEPVVAG